MTSKTQWRWVDRKGVQRSLTAGVLHEALRSGKIGRDAPIWCEGMESFEPAGRVAEFADSCRHAPVPTSADPAPVGQVVESKGAALEALRRMINRDRGRGSKGGDKKPEAPATVPPPARAKKIMPLGVAAPARSPSFVPPKPLPASPIAAPVLVPKRIGTPLHMPPPPTPRVPSPDPPTPDLQAPAPETKTSPAAFTYAQMQPVDQGLREDTPPATPLALHASGRRSSSPAPNTSQADPPQVTPPIPPPTPPKPPKPAIPTTRFDQTQPSLAMKAEFERQLAHRRRMRIILPIFGVVGGVVMLGIVGLILGVLVSKRKPQVDPVVGAIPSAEEPVAAISDQPPAVEPAPAEPAVPCVYRGPRKRLVVGASKDVPIEVWSAPDQASVAVGFASHTQTALGFVLDPKTISPERSFTRNMTSTLTRVVPVRSESTITFETDVDNPSASVRNTLTVPTTPPLKLGTFKNSLTIGELAESVPDILWQLPFADPIEAMRAIPVPSKGLGVVFRAKDGIWIGWVDESRKPLGSLSRIEGTGVKVGTPSIGWNGREVLVTFANQEKPKGPWTIRIARLPFGEAPQTTFEWAVPEGGPGGAVIAPSILGLSDGRWVMVWTEGEPGERSVRLQTYDANFLPVGDPFVASRAKSNAGQGMAAIGKSGGIVVYLSALGRHYEVWGAGIDCR